MNINKIISEEIIEGVSQIEEFSVNVSTPFKMAEFIITPFSKTPVDKHEVAEIWRILSGHGKLYYQDAEHPINKNDWFFFYPFEEHQVENTTENELKILSIYWKS